MVDLVAVNVEGRGVLARELFDVFDEHHFVEEGVGASLLVDILAELLNEFELF